MTYQRYTVQSTPHNGILIFDHTAGIYLYDEDDGLTQFPDAATAQTIADALNTPDA